MPYYAQERRLNHRTTTTIEKKGRPRSKPADSTTFSDHTASLAADVDWEIQADCTRVGRRADSSRKLFKRNGTAVKDISFKKKRNVFDEDENWVSFPHVYTTYSVDLTPSRRSIRDLTPEVS